MKPVFYAAIMALAAGQAGAVAMSSASGSVSIKLMLDDPADAGALSSVFAAPVFVQRDRIPTVPPAPSEGVLTIDTADDWPGDAEPPLDFDGMAAATVTADGAPPPFSGIVGGYVDNYFEASVDIQNTSMAEVGFTLVLDYALDAAVSFDRPIDEDVFTTAFASLDFLLMDDAFNIVGDVQSSVFVDAFLQDPMRLLTDDAGETMMWAITLGAGEVARFDAVLNVIVEAESDGFGATPIPVPPALALLPAGLGLLAAIGRRRRV